MKERNKFMLKKLWKQLLDEQIYKQNCDMKKKKIRIFFCDEQTLWWKN